MSKCEMPDCDKVANWYGSKNLCTPCLHKAAVEVMDLQKKLDNLREYCHAEGYDIFNWEVKNIEVIE